MNRLFLTAIIFVTAMLSAVSAFSRVLEVGPHHDLKLPSEAAVIARPGDSIRIDPGTYTDCAVWTAPHLVIEAAAPGVVLSGKTCLDKGIFVIFGNDETVRGITFAGAAAAGHNGAGIKATGMNLTVEHSRFLNNENGILAGGPATSVLHIADSEFIGNGSCAGACAHGVYAGAPIHLLDIEHCVFRATRIAHHIKSRALNTVIRDSRIEDGPDGTSSYLIETPNGGNMLVQGNVLQKGQFTSNPDAAISIGVEGMKNPTKAIIIRDNTFRSDVSGLTVFVRASTAVPIVMEGNVLSGIVQALKVLPEQTGGY